MTSSRSALVTLGAALALSASIAVPSAGATAATAATAPPGAVVRDWYDTTAQTVAVAGAATQITNSRTWAISWLAAARATREAPAGRDRAAFQDAAVASAVHDSLVALAPARAPELDAALAASLRRIPDGRAEDRGVAAGARQARLALAARQGDGLDPESVNAPFAVPPSAPGVWQPTPAGYAPAVQYGNRLARPFLLDSPSQYRLGPPPALDSRRYRADLAEVRAYGKADSAVRTARQTETATFWYGSSLTLYTEPLRVALTRSHGSTAERAGLVALFHAALVDTQIATSDSKYAYTRWRPVTAIRTGSIGTDPAWTPLHETPAHPDYPSGHATYAGAAEAVLDALTGARTAPFTLTSPTAPGVTRTYTGWEQLTRDNVEARILSGIHTRSADEAGVVLGKAVGRHALRGAERLLEPLG
ncbi:MULTISPECIES: vanadium-dependent haloperoxidase [unclassified Streptomyces]|uniref:vanadium-dependent haloperoxidase n=1 Tax=unclassified Streptomyces TaxID=2593676 RepID=UPI00225A309D|nr:MULTISPECIES: vanadium-dependent haloperoxidase [unclassified Streptomyces]MCX4525061.1 vanadium-dependent haloperoxidase [Streptomyces sp. NBC_01551]MCX4544428.1 vanadium-dependent haloperoxidase [Streptomyces sp. NBC_01565]